MATTTRTGNRSTLQTAAAVVGATFLAVGILGFVPGITTNYEALAFAGPDSDARLLGIFEVSILHNIVHLLFGIVGLMAAKTFAGSRSFLIGGGAVYIVLFLYGLVTGDETPANFVPLNMADDWLHLLLGAGMIGLGTTLGRGVTASTRHS